MKNELKEIYTKNRTCYYFDDIINNNDVDFDNILLGKNSLKTFQFIMLLYKAP